jgi:ABC-type multidrug transport system ATPase subunit
MNPDTMPLILQAHGLNFSYPDLALFANFSIKLPAGITLICGGGGRGKTTLLRLLAGELPAQSGQLQINGIDLQAQPEAYKAQVFWNDPRSTAFDPLSLPGYFDLQRSRYPEFDDRVLTDMSKGLALQEQWHKQLFMLSTGSKRKVFLAAAFASGTALTLLDEPFAALDTTSIAFLMTKLKDAARESQRAWVLADFVAPTGLPLVQTIELGD